MLYLFRINIKKGVYIHILHIIVYIQYYYLFYFIYLQLVIKMWKHDKYDAGSQQTKTNDEIILQYGYNIRDSLHEKKRRDKQSDEGTHRNTQSDEGTHRDTQPDEKKRRDIQSDEGTHRDTQSDEGTHRDTQPDEKKRRDIQSDEGTHRDTQSDEGNRNYFQPMQCDRVTKKYQPELLSDRTTRDYHLKTSSRSSHTYTTSRDLVQMCGSRPCYTDCLVSCDEESVRSDLTCASIRSCDRKVILCDSLGEKILVQCSVSPERPTRPLSSSPPNSSYHLDLHLKDFDACSITSSTCYDDRRESGGSSISCNSVGSVSSDAMVRKGRGRGSSFKASQLRAKGFGSTWEMN